MHSLYQMFSHVISLSALFPSTFLDVLPTNSLWLAIRMPKWVKVLRVIKTIFKHTVVLPTVYMHNAKWWPICLSIKIKWKLNNQSSMRRMIHKKHLNIRDYLDFSVHWLVKFGFHPFNLSFKNHLMMIYILQFNYHFSVTHRFDTPFTQGALFFSHLSHVCLAKNILLGFKSIFFT